MKKTGYFILACFFLALPASYYGQPLMRDNPDAVTITITVITVFAGFLVAIITILGDPSAIPQGSWRKAEARHDRLEATIIRHTWLFYSYLATIGFLFAGVLLRKQSDQIVSSAIKGYVENAYLFLAVFSFLLTLALPSSLGRIQMERSSAEIEARRLAEGIGSGDET